VCQAETDSLRCAMKIVFFFIVAYSCPPASASQDQNERGSKEIEELKQAVLESHRNLLAIQAAFESENEATKERLQILEDNLDETRMELVRTKVELAESRSQLTRFMTWRAESSFMSVCGYQSASWPTLGTVHFDSIASEYNNPGHMLDISTGVFTSYTAGVYTINYNVLSWINYGGGEVKMILLHNGVELPETEMYSYSDVHAHDMASRTTIKFLAVGDTLELVATSLSNGSKPTRITMCVSMNEEWL